jgi:beta-glucanase (GH16 family)
MRICSPVLVLLLGVPQHASAQQALSDRWVAFDRAGAPNSALQCFTPSEVAVSRGYLVLRTESRITVCSSYDLHLFFHRYASAFVAMRSFNFLYGDVEVRARFGGGMGSGSWPAIWLADASCQPSDPTGTDEHCNEQEVDIAEILGSDFAKVYQWIHVNRFKYNDHCEPRVSDTATNFHIYGLQWSPGSLVFRIDGIATCTIRQPYVPNAPMYLKISAFVGRLGGPISRSSLPWSTLIDYVKITQGHTVVFEDDFGSPSAPR